MPVPEALLKTKGDMAFAVRAPGLEQSGQGHQVS